MAARSGSAVRRQRALALVSPDAPAPVSAGRPLGSVLEFLRVLWGLNHALESASRRMKSRLGVTGPERMVVRLVGRYPGVSAGELAHILRVHPSTLTGLLRRLVARGILTRRPDVRDRRRALFALTLRGAAVDSTQQGTVEASVKLALESLGPGDVGAAAEVLDAVARRLQRPPRRPRRGDPVAARRAPH
jgi:MarR family transcriptional regulator, organic hydroperoxide resistance regulator